MVIDIGVHRRMYGDIRRVRGWQRFLRQRLILQRKHVYSPEGSAIYGRICVILAFLGRILCIRRKTACNQGAFVLLCYEDIACFYIIIMKT